MNLLHVVPYYAPAWRFGGAVRAVTDLTRAQAEAGHRVFVLTTDALGPGERVAGLHEMIDGVDVTRVRNRSAALRSRLNLSTPAGIAPAAERLIRAHAIDAVHCHEVRTVENLRVAPVARRLGVPLLVSPHGTLPLDTGRGGVKRLWDRLFARRLLPGFDRVIALTAAEAADARAIWAACGVPLPPERVSVVPNGVHLGDFAHLPPGDPFRARWNLGSGPVVLFLGRLHERKGAQLLIPAFAQARGATPEARLVIAGPDEGMLATLHAQARELGVEQRVVFTGLLDGEDRLAALSAADLFALPAVGEGFSMAVLEALACGLPVVLTPGCHFPEAEQAGAGVVVERAVEPLAGALRALLTDPGRRAAMGRAARALVERDYTWPQVVARLDEAYRAAIAEKVAGRGGMP
ncbi:MAG: glycosyltransferase [Anaerolineae bacterium]|nr:glycosyltransferase [Anaerolineae bacterium]